MLMGKYLNSIDAKCRMIIPAKHRESLGYRCVLTKGIDQCVDIYSFSAWENFMEKLSAIPTSDNAGRQFVRHFFANACECEIDKQGRVVIPQELRAYAEIEKELVTIGFMNKIEVWSKEKWESAMEGAGPDASDIARKMAEYGI